MGAWIETDIALLSSAGFTVSRPAWARGLKQSMLALINKMFMVAPRMGAWIETASSYGADEELDVAPRMGAWIETTRSCW